MHPKLPKKLKILVVDDMSLLVDKMVKILKDIGFTQIQTATDGEQALKYLICEQAANEPFDLAICDINMPKMNGIKLLQRAKKIHAFDQTKFFMVTTRSEMETVLSAIELGASNYLIKPFDENSIREKIFDIFYPGKNN